ncbi:hypothetical protein [Nitrospira moscoviensis]|uniref:Uncharacterized protein n=1 Tax=Nitrospira moscoviensis TaxID=42253 RepID=A0A0K2GJ20_NITMO|nr:hypothetical protein [Nitrospira moscoviensis]ALA60943.1 hypothetical protein NITMOv2_4570 [Nitrospira moscoviensis]
MKRVVIEDLQPGMVLAKPVVNGAGLPVVAAGAQLDSTMIQRLSTLAVTAVYVEGESGDTAGQTLAELAAGLERRFRGVVQDPVQRLIFERLLAHLRSTRGMLDPDRSADR